MKGKLKREQQKRTNGGALLRSRFRVRATVFNVAKLRRAQKDKAFLLGRKVPRWFFPIF